MGNEELKTYLTELLPSASFEDGADWLHVIVASTDWLAFATTLREQDPLRLDYLFCMTCVDWKTHLSMIYHLRSMELRHEIVVKCQLNNSAPEIASVSGIWKTAIFHEREVYEMFGVDFTGHPDLRLLILPDGWEGRNPMRKDFEDPVNMIRL